LTYLACKIITIILFESGNTVHKHTNKRHTDRQIDSMSRRKKKKKEKKCNTRCTIKYSKTYKNADGHTHRSSFTRSLLCSLQTHRKQTAQLPQRDRAAG